MTLRLLGELAVLAMSLSSARATLLYSNCGTGCTTFSGTPLGAQGNGGYAMPFVPILSGPVVDVELPLIATSSTDTFKIVIARSNASVPGSALETLFITGVPTSAAVITVNSIAHPILNSGTTYWLELLANGSSPVGWFETSPPVTGPVQDVFTSNGGQTWQALGSTLLAFAVETPEPSSLVLILSGIATAAVLRRVKRT